MTPLEQKAVDIAIPVATYLLGLAFPAIPSVVFSILFKGLQDGDIDGAALQAFLAEHNIKAVDEYPTGRNGQTEDLSDS